MRGKWNMREWEIDLWKGVIQKHIERLKNSITEDEIDLTEENINPYQVSTIMKELGWESDEVETNGWEQERWEYFSHPDYPGQTICVFSCGLTFELSISLSTENEDE